MYICQCEGFLANVTEKWYPVVGVPMIKGGRCIS